jgi:hypothetical protein
VTRYLLEAMLKPMRDPLPTGVAYVRNAGEKLKVVDNRKDSERRAPGQDITSLTALNPALAEKLIHPLIPCAHSILVKSLEDKMDDLFPDGVDKENAAPIDEPLLLLTDLRIRDNNYKTLIRQCTSLEIVAWHLFSEVYGFGLDGNYKDIGANTFNVDPLVKDAVLKAYPIIYGEEIVGDAEHDALNKKMAQQRKEERDEDPEACNLKENR